MRVGRSCLETFLDGLDLLRDGRQHSLLQTIELVEAAPSADLAQANEDSAHGLKFNSNDIKYILSSEQFIIFKLSSSRNI
jgi:hypothetical protein